ncbi:MAG: NADH-quinone oxidoreductase subunit M [Chloroflexi bacterium]|nr:NADH-quinone oxidoreductase subunit M [Chloroflexota bacterium]
MLSAIVFLPLAGAIIIGLLVRPARWVRYVAATVAVADLALAIWAFVLFDTSVPQGLQMVERADWISAFRIQYFLGVDGLSMPLVLLTALLGMCAVFASWHIQERVREYFVWLLVLQTAVTGVFVAQDFILFFIFWEMELVPMYLLISVWGTGRRENSAMKFVAFTFLGSAFMLAAILVVFFSVHSFDMEALATAGLGRLLVPTRVVFLFFFLAFAIKLPVWPVHTWLPDAHTDAPTAVSVMLAGVLLKMGGYGLIRINLGMFPQEAATLGGPMMALAVISVLYGAMVVFRQSDLKRLVAYSSVSHMGFVLLGISSVGAAARGVLNPVGLNGAALQMFSHGVITGLLFLLVGLVYERAHTRHIPHLGGLASRMPFIATVFLIAGLASLGLPATSGFVAEFLVFVGTFRVAAWPTALAAFGVVLAAGYILWMIERSLFGPQVARHEGVTDASLVDAVPMVALVIAIVAVGLYPAVLTNVFSAGLGPIIARFGP